MSERIVAIDGPSGAGKSTVARLLADRLGFLYIDTGAMYRAVGLRAVREGIDAADDARLAAMCAQVSVRLERNAGEPRVFLDGEDVSAEIRTPAISLAASRFSAHPAVRAAMTRLQREMGRAGGVVMEGRDIGTVVFPDARHKFFLTASEEERARRRLAQLHLSGHVPTFDEVLADLRRRDADDSAREHAPLAVAPDALVVDTTRMTVEEVVEFLYRRVVGAGEPSAAMTPAPPSGSGVPR